MGVSTFSSSSSPPFLGLLTYARPIAPRRGALQKAPDALTWWADGLGRRNKKDEDLSCAWWGEASG